MATPTDPTGVPTAAATSAAARRAAFSAATRQALVDAAEPLFTEAGYAHVPLERIVARAAVTKGALYHHFSGKQALFEAVFRQVEDDAARRIGEALAAHDDPWARARGGLRAFLDVVQEPAYRRVVVQDGPAVLGHERYHEEAERSTYANVVDIVDAVAVACAWDADEAMVATFARIFFGAMTAAGASIVSADGPEAATAAADRVDVAISFVIAGFQSLAESGATLPSLPGLPGLPGPAPTRR